MWQAAAAGAAVALALQLPGLLLNGPVPPNVVVLFVDDLGYGDLGYGGFRPDAAERGSPSPNLDQLAASGVQFDQWMSGSGICTPSRGALLTGRLPVRIGLASSDYKTRVFHPTSPTGLPLSELTLAEALKERGYATHLTGKWHLGIGQDENGTVGAYLPTGHGFDHFYGFPITNVQTCMPGKTIYTQKYLFMFLFDNTRALWLSMLGGALAARAFGLVGDKGFGALLVTIAFAFLLGLHITSMYTLMGRHNCLLYRDREIEQQPVELFNLTQRLTADATAFIRQSSARRVPFFLYMSYIKVHTALFNNPEFGTIDYFNNIRELDWSVGTLMALLDELRIADDTIVFFTSDNGPFKERGKEGGSSGPLRGAKGQTYEGGIRVPGIMRYPRKVGSGIRTNEPVSTMDIFPTTLGYVDAVLGIPTTNFSQPYGVLDGKDLGPFLASLRTRLSTALSSPHRVMFHYCGEELAALRLDGRYKVVFQTTIWEGGYDSCPSSSMCGCTGSAVNLHDPPLIFDLDNDISESTPLPLTEYEKRKERIEAAVQSHRASLETGTQPNQMKLMQNLWLLPCCNPPKCQCDTDLADPSLHKWYREAPL